MIRSVLVVATALLALTSCSSADDSTTPPPSSSPSASPTSTTSTAPADAARPSVPKVGQCYRLSFEQALAPTTRTNPSKCRGATAQTAYVGTIDALVDGHLLAVDSDRVQASIARTCPREVASYVGASERDLRLSMVRPVWFSPTLAESDAGAMWFRCDVVSLASDKDLAPLSSMKGALARGGDRYAVCGTTKPDDPRFARVACAQKHAWRAIDSYDIGGDGYPGAAAMRAAGEDVCKSIAEKLAEDSLDFEWALDWPTKEQWGNGQRWGLCWAPEG